MTHLPAGCASAHIFLSGARRVKWGAVSMAVSLGWKWCGRFHLQGRRCTPASARGGGPVSEQHAAAAGWQVPAEPTMPRLNSQVLGF